MLLAAIIIALTVTLIITLEKENIDKSKDGEDPSEKNITNITKTGIITHIYSNNGIHKYIVETNDEKEYEIESEGLEFIVSDEVTITIVYNQEFKEIMDVFINK